MSAPGIRERLAGQLSRSAEVGRTALWPALLQREPVRTLASAMRNFQRDRGWLWTSALTYTTGLSLVPVLALMLSVVSYFGGVQRMRPFIERYLTAAAPDMTERLLAMVTNVDAGALGSVGAAALIITVIATMGTVEQAFNAIFTVASQRSLTRKVADYVSVTFTVPIVAVSVAAGRGALLHHTPLPAVASEAYGWLMTWAAIFFLYVFFPNRSVPWRSAAIGSFAASIMLTVAQWGFVHFQYGIARDRAIYGALAVVPIILTWIYMSWLIVLFGGELVATSMRTDAGEAGLAQRSDLTCYAVLLAALRAAERMSGRRSKVTRESLSQEAGANAHAIGPAIDALKTAGIS